MRIKLKKYPFLLAAILFLFLAPIAHVLINHAFPGSGFRIMKSDGLIKGMPYGIEFVVRI